ncbi:MAG TPA: FKBP-type peptidyl-prolyl cis-trans isomerase, partial [Polyangia bacterium]|nr:FKBP-type peptidyl-prolyl cis-trans isomerase [Polyangia bacterium]
MRRSRRTFTSTTVLLAAFGFGACNKEAPASPPTPPPPSAPKAPPPAAETPPPPPRNPDDLPPPDDVKAPPADAKKTDSGLAYKVLKPGTGKEKPTPADTVEVHYTGWTTDGRMFDSSVKRGQPAHFPVGAVIKGWTEGLQLMTVGEKTRFWIPAGLAYGDTPGGGRPAGMLVFDVELLGITAPPKTPEDVAAPPKSAKKTKSGIAYRVLKKGTGKEHPTAQSTVEVHYTGWTTDGRM